jgi:regulator of RNase E activity RraA
MTRSDPDVLTEIAAFDTPSVFNAVRTLLGGGPEGEGLENRGGVPVNYTDHTMRAMLPDLGMSVGYATTCEVTTNNRDFPALPWESYYDYLEATPEPTMTVIKDVGTRPGRGSSIGDIMAEQHKLLGSKGMVVDGTVRDIRGLRRAGIPIWAWGQVSGHGLFFTTRFDAPITVADLAVNPGDLLAADTDGVVKIPHSIDPVDLLAELEAIARREEALVLEYGKPGATLAGIRDYFDDGFWEAGAAAESTGP